MHKYAYTLFFALLLTVGNSSAFCDESPNGAISEKEYFLFRQVLLAQSGWTSLSAETLSDIQADADWLNPPVGIQLTTHLINDFNVKNSKAYRLSEAFLQEKFGNTSAGLEEKKRITLSRAGFDHEKGQALLIMAITYTYPEDVMNEGKYVFFENRDGHWKIRQTIKAWGMRLGPIR